MKIDKERIFLATIGDDYKNIAKKYGFGIELDQFSFSQNMDSPDEINAVWEELKEFREPQSKSDLQNQVSQQSQVETANRKNLILHGPFTEIFPAAIDPKARLLAMDRLKQAYEIAERLGIDKMVAHSGYAPFTYFKSWQVERSIEFWSEFLAWVAEKRAKAGLPQFTLLVENVLDDEPDMLCEIVAGVRALSQSGAGSCKTAESRVSAETDKSGEFEGCDKPAEYVKADKSSASWSLELAQIGVCLDIGHANCISPLPLEQWIESLAPYLMHTHIHNNFGERGKDLHLPPGEGALDVKALIEKIEGMSAAGLCGSVTYTEECMDCESAALWFFENFQA